MTRQPIKRSGGIQAHAVRRSDLFWLRPDQLEIEPGFNLRQPSEELDASIRAIADNIKANGFRVDGPFLVRTSSPGRYFVTDGHCRQAAMIIALTEGADIEALPCLPEPKGWGSIERTLAMMVTPGRAVDPFGLARGVMLLQSYGMPDAEIARRNGHGIGWLNGLLTLNAAPQPVRDAVVAGTISPTLATRLAGMGPAEAVATLAKAKAINPGQRVTAATVRQSQPRVLSEMQQLVNALIDAWDQIDPKTTPILVQDAIERLRPHYFTVKD